MDGWSAKGGARALTEDAPAGRAIVGDVATFRGVAPDKAQALKPLEEATEVYAAWQALEEAGEDEVR